MLRDPRETIDRGALFRDTAAVERVMKSAIREVTGGVPKGKLAAPNKKKKSKVKAGARRNRSG